MKKSLFLVFMLMLSLTGFAQQTHLKFMGIELNGSITEFQKKLQSKGLTISNLSSHCPTGQLMFDGVFSGETAQVIVWFNPRSKQVYRAKALIERYGKDQIQQLMNEMEVKLDTKYGTEKKYSEMVKDDHLHEFNQISYFTGNGVIGLFITSSGYTSQSTFTLHIDYVDKENYAKNTADEIEDL